MALRDLPIKRKLTLISMLTSGVALLLACGAFVLYGRLIFQDEMRSDVATISKIIGFNSAAALSFDDARSAEETLRSMAATREITRACIYRKSGEVFATYLRPGETPRPWPAPRPATTFIDDEGVTMFHVIRQDEADLGTIYIHADLSAMHAFLRRCLVIAGVVMLVAAGIALGITSHAQRIISDPVSELASIARRVADDRNYTVRAVKQSDDELGHLIDGFNAMLAQIQVRDAALQHARDELEQRVIERTAELQRAEQHAAEQAAQLRFIFEAVPIGVSWVRYDTHEVLLNESFFRISGLRRDDFSGNTAVRAISHPDDLERQDEMRAALERGETDCIQIEKRYLRPDGSVTWVELTIKVFRRPDGRIAQEVCSVVDITGRKEAEQRLASSISTLNATLEATPDGILVVNSQGRFLDYNRKFCELWRLSPEILATHTDVETMQLVLQQLADEEQFVRKVQELYAHPDAESFDLLEFKDGRVYERFSQPHRIDGVTGGRVWCFRDVTERKRAEERLAATHKQLVDTSRLAGMAEVATGVLHNVGNVLNSVNVSATVLIDQLRDSKSVNVAKVAALLRDHAADVGEFVTRDERGRRIPGYLALLADDLAAERAAMHDELEHLRKHLEHIKGIVAMQQTYARVSGVEESVALTELVEDALRMDAGSLGRHGLELVRDYQAQPVVTTQRHKVLQVLVNLLRNAKFACLETTRADKRVTVRIAADDGIQISVIDNGVGIPAENLTRIFHLGFTTRREGHGFGLHSGALIARELGGSLLARSAGVGQGATFTLHLPFPDQASS